MATTATTSSGITRISLSAREKFRLTQFIMTKYKASGLADIDFAKLAEEEFKLPITASHISYIRHEFEVPANGKGMGLPKGRMNALEERVKILEEQVTTLLRERSHPGGLHLPNGSHK